MSKTAIYYFSATGNSLVVANHLAKELGVGDPVSIPGSLVNKDPYIAARGAEVLGFVFPVQRATIPEMLRGFIQSMPINPDCYYFAVSNYSLFGSNEFWDIDELLVSRGAALNYTANVRMMGNVGLVSPSQATICKRLDEMERQLEVIATAISYRQENYFPRANKLLAWAVRHFAEFRRKHILFRIHKRCNGCGICVLVCPAQNIQLNLEGSVPVAPIRSNKCEACLACVHWCPASAISTSGRVHTSYHNPRVLPGELHQITPKASSDLLTGDALLSSISHNGKVQRAEAIVHQHEDLPLIADAKTWIYEAHADQGSPNSEKGDQSAELQKPGMSSAEIAQALLDIER
ncbi:MAG: EFR1 family ferrodoxin [Coriobacteriia bacterium]|nr:EFR1 family ferrodoxin [Coriobacteriia bacterium]